MVVCEYFRRRTFLEHIGEEERFSRYKGGNSMPYVNIKITREGEVTAEQKRRLIEGATDLLHDVLGKNKATTVVTIDEVDTDNWGIGGVPVTEIRKKVK